MKLRVDQEKCQGHNRCYMLAPDLIDVDDMGTAFERNKDGSVPPDQEEKAQLAADNCPEFAIIISED